MKSPAGVSSMGAAFSTPLDNINAVKLQLMLPLGLKRLWDKISPEATRGGPGERGKLRSQGVRRSLDISGLFDQLLASGFEVARLYQRAAAKDNKGQDVFAISVTFGRGLVTSSAGDDQIAALKEAMQERFAAFRIYKRSDSVKFIVERPKGNAAGDNPIARVESGYLLVN